MNHRDDIYHPLRVDLGSGRLALERDDALHIEQMMRQVLLTAPGERINRPDFGCGLRRIVFAPNSELSAHLLKITIYQSLTKWLGDRIKVEDVSVSSSEETLAIHIVYSLRVRGGRRFLNLEVER